MYYAPFCTENVRKKKEFKGNVSYSSIKKVSSIIQIIKDKIIHIHIMKTKNNIQ